VYEKLLFHHSQALPVTSGSKEEQPYYFVRRTILRNVDLEKLSAELSPRFSVVRPFVSNRENILGRESGSFEVKADTLYALFEVDRATLFQKVRRPFAQRDLELRSIVFKRYGMQLPLFAREPSFERE